MAKHRAPTQVTIASTHEETALHRWVERTWKPALGAAVGIAVVIVGMQLLREKSAEAEVESWRRLGQEVTFSAGSLNTPSAAVLGELATELRGDAAGPWAKALQVGESLRQEDFEGARRALEELERTWPDHPLVRARLYPREDGLARTLREQVEAGVPVLESWEAGHPELFSNPDLPAGAPRVRLNTDQGPLVIGLYAERAPRHTENFLKLVREGFYDGTKFHRVVRGKLIQGGDPNTREGEPDTWGQGGPGYTIEPEIDGLWHFRGAVAAARKAGDESSSGSQFYVLVSDMPELDGEYTVFGRLVEGEATLEAIATAPVDGERPQDPAVIESSEVLE